MSKVSTVDAVNDQTANIDLDIKIFLVKSFQTQFGALKHLQVMGAKGKIP